MLVNVYRDIRGRHRRKTPQIDVSVHHLVPSPSPPPSLHFVQLKCVRKMHATLRALAHRSRGSFRTRNNARKNTTQYLSLPPGAGASWYADSALSKVVVFLTSCLHVSLAPLPCRCTCIHWDTLFSLAALVVLFEEVWARPHLNFLHEQRHEGVPVRRCGGHYLSGLCG